MSKFKIGLSIVFSVFIVLGILVFALSKGTSNGISAHITVWGFIPQSSFDAWVYGSPLSKEKNLTVSYVEKSPTQFEDDFVNALANGVGPDVIMISQDMVLKNQNKIFVIPYKSYNERTFKDAFIQESELFLGTDGVIALPLYVDPLVMYWNRDIFSSAGLPLPPKYWDEFLTLPNTLTKINRSGNITQSTVALGEWSNVSNAKAILSDLLFSAGSLIVERDLAGFQGTLLQTNSQVTSPADASVSFYTQFANPTSQTYSWNRSLPNSLDYFLSGNSALYFGFASELPKIRNKNPNLNFDVAFIPQQRQPSGQTAKKTVFANIYGLSIVKQSKNINVAFQVITALTTNTTLSQLETNINLPPVSRTLLATPPVDPYKVVFYQSALVSQGWLDPDSVATNEIFQNMIESITGGRARVSEAISHANDELDVLLH